MRTAFALTLLLGACAKKAPPEPTLTERAMQTLKAVDPTIAVHDKGNDTIWADLGGDAVHPLIISLDNVRAVCKSAPTSCDGQLQQLAATYRAAIDGRKNADKPVDPATVRFAIKDSRWIAGASAPPPGSTGVKGPELVSQKLIGSLSIVYVTDLPSGMRFLRPEDVTKLHLTLAELDALARKNVLAAHPKPLMSPLGDSGVYTNDDSDGYGAAMLAFPEVWAPLAKQIKGPLWVSVPARDRVFAASGTLSGNKLRAVTEKAIAEEDHPISNAVFVWSDKGFTLVEDKP